MATTTETWLDVMPAIPLARSVPVVSRSRQGGWVVLGAGGASAESHGWVRLGAHTGPYWDDVHPHEPVQVGLLLLRPDLDDPQGFGYAVKQAGIVALRGHFAKSTGMQQAQKQAHAVVWRWMAGTTTEDDKLVVATVLRGAA